MSRGLKSGAIVGSILTDPFKDADGKGRVVHGVCVYSGATRLAELAALIGFDTVWIEMEHGPAGFEAVEAQCTAGQAGGGWPTVRIPDGQRSHVLRALESGASMVVVPMVNTAEQARQIVEYGKFPPLGSRGYNTRSRGVGYGLAPFSELFSHANARTHLFAQIETMQAVGNVEAICAVEGLAGIFIGPGDLSVSAGCCGDMSNSRLIEIVTQCIGAARKVNKHAGILVGQGPLLDAALAAGCDLAFSSGDVTELVKTWSRLLETLRGQGNPM
jgi:2-keto-3-deoxy-L-rhamnonate aldolase RhmA